MVHPAPRKIGPGTGKPVNVTFVGAGGQSVTVECPEDQYILDAGIDAGLELPFTCRGGICGACVAKCVSGRGGWSIGNSAHNTNTSTVLTSLRLATRPLFAFSRP